MGRSLHDRIKDSGFEVWGLAFVDASTLRITDVEKFEAAENSRQLGGFLLVPLASVPEVMGESYQQEAESDKKTSVLYRREIEYIPKPPHSQKSVYFFKLQLSSNLLLGLCF